MEQVQPRPEFGLKSRNDSSNGTSIWELMQPENKSKKTSIQHEPMAQHSMSSSAEARNRRRDPIGYFSDTKYGDQLQQQQLAHAAAFENNRRAAYEPSWNNGGEPIAVNGFNQ